jgi:glutamate-1-semialdehyde 2,1-aminomutase
MEILRRPGQYEKLRQTGKRLQNMQSDHLNKAGIAHQIVGDETLFDVLFTKECCIDYRSTKHNQPALAALYNKTLREHGILKSPSKLYPSLAISEDDLHQTEAAVNMAVDAISQI